jgi:hypothetical protein
MSFYRKLLIATQNNGLKRSTADPCLYYKWERANLVTMISWINNNMILVQEDLIMQAKTMKLFESDDCGCPEESVGNKIEYDGDDAIRFVQMVMLQRYSNKFKLEKKCFNMPAIPGTVLKKPAEDGKVLDGNNQTVLRSGIGKLIYHMQYLRLDIAQAVSNLVRHMTQGDETHMAVMLRCMQYLTCTKDAGLLLKPTRK